MLNPDYMLNNSGVFVLASDLFRKLVLVPESNSGERLLRYLLDRNLPEFSKLLEKDVDVNFQDEEGMTALHHAASRGARPFIRLLVKSGKCDYLIQDREGRYASDLAIRWARDYAVGRLLSIHQCSQAWERGVPAWEPPPHRKLQSSVPKP
jgi:ankyrin repeat protein